MLICWWVLLRLGGGVLPYMAYIGMCGSKGYGFLAALVSNRYGFCTLVLNWVCCIRANYLTVSLLLIGLSTKALHITFNIGLNWRTSLKGMSLCSIWYQIFVQVINRVGKIADTGLKKGKSVGKSTPGCWDNKQSFTEVEVNIYHFHRHWGE